jgi:hypothetical protein
MPLGPIGPTNFKNSATYPHLYCITNQSELKLVHSITVSIIIIKMSNNIQFLNDVLTFLMEVGSAGRIVNTGTSSVNSEFVTALNT